MSGRIEKWLDGLVGLAMRARLAGGMKTWQWAQACGTVVPQDCAMVAKGGLRCWRQARIYYFEIDFIVHAPLPGCQLDFAGLKVTKPP
jgi:hypothetical protein